jgi:hypothetical protein
VDENKNKKKQILNERDVKLPSNFLNHFEELCLALSTSSLFILLLAAWVEKFQSMNLKYFL